MRFTAEVGLGLFVGSLSQDFRGHWELFSGDINVCELTQLK